MHWTGHMLDHAPPIKLSALEKLKARLQTASADLADLGNPMLGILRVCHCTRAEDGGLTEPWHGLQRR